MHSFSMSLSCCGSRGRTRCGHGSAERFRAGASRGAFLPAGPEPDPGQGAGADPVLHDPGSRRDRGAAELHGLGPGGGLDRSHAVPAVLAQSGPGAGAAATPTRSRSWTSRWRRASTGSRWRWRIRSPAAKPRAASMSRRSPRLTAPPTCLVAPEMRLATADDTVPRPGEFRTGNNLVTAAAQVRADPAPGQGVLPAGGVLGVGPGAAR